MKCRCCILFLLHSYFTIALRNYEISIMALILLKTSSHAHARTFLLLYNIVLMIVTIVFHWMLLFLVVRVVHCRVARTSCRAAQCSGRWCVVSPAQGVLQPLVCARNNWYNCATINRVSGLVIVPHWNMWAFLVENIVLPTNCGIMEYFLHTMFSTLNIVWMYISGIKMREWFSFDISHWSQLDACRECALNERKK